MLTTKISLQCPQVTLNLPLIPGTVVPATGPPGPRDVRLMIRLLKRSIILIE